MWFYLSPVMRMSLNNKKESRFLTLLGQLVPHFGVTNLPAARMAMSTGNRPLRAFNGMQSVVSFAAEKSPASMRSLTHALNIGTLATWMSVAAFGSAGVMLGKAAYAPVVTNEPGVELVHTLDVESVEGADNLSETAKDQAVTESIDLPEPPNMLPALPNEALPDVPEMAIADVRKISIAINRPVKSSVKTEKSSAVANNASAGAAATMSNAARLAAGRMPAPRYPSEARSKGQTGTVLIEFTVDPSGRVSTAHIATPCPWSVLNEEALRAVRNWKFPPGSVMTFKKPIVFKLRNS
jgi:TonB family protein